MTYQQMQKQYKHVLKPYNHRPTVKIMFVGWETGGHRLSGEEHLLVPEREKMIFSYEAKARSHLKPEMIINSLK